MVKTRSGKRLRQKRKRVTISQKSITINQHAYSSNLKKIRKPIKNSLGALVLLAVKNSKNGTICQILNELTALRVQITRDLLERVLKYFQEKRILKMDGCKFRISKSGRAKNYLKKLFPYSINRLKDQ